TGGAHRGEEAEGAPARGPDELLDLVERLRGQPVTARGRAVLGDVGDRLLGIGEGGPDVESSPGWRALAAQPAGAGDCVEGAAELEGGGGEDGGATRRSLLACLGW